MKKFFAQIALAVILASFANPAVATPIGNPIVSVQSSVAEGSRILKTTGGTFLNGFSATSGSVAGYVLIFDSATVPADGTVTPKLCYSIPATSTTGASWLNYPIPFSNGIVIVFSSTGCFSKTVSATAFFSAQVQ